MTSMLPLPTSTPHTMKNMKNMQNMQNMMNVKNNMYPSFAGADITSNQESEGASIKGPSHGVKVQDPSEAMNITAANTYRELRMLRSRVRVPVNSIPVGTKNDGNSGSYSAGYSAGNSAGNLAYSGRNDGDSRSVYLGRQRKGEMAELIEKYTLSILVCGGSLKQ